MTSTETKTVVYARAVAQEAVRWAERAQDAGSTTYTYGPASEGYGLIEIVEVAVVEKRRETGALLDSVRTERVLCTLDAQTAAHLTGTMVSATSKALTPVNLTREG